MIQAEDNQPTCGICAQEMTPEDSKIHPERFMHDRCLPQHLIPEELRSQPHKTREQIEEIISQIKFMDRKFRLLDKGDGYLLQLTYMEADVETGKMEEQHARKWYISPFMTETEIVESAFAACRRSMEHVVGEHFLYRGQRVYSPHFKVGDRLALAMRGDLDGRVKKKDV